MVEDGHGGDERGAPSQGRRFATAVERLGRVRHRFIQASGMGVAELRLLWLLSDGQPRTQREIGAALHLDQSTVSRQVAAAISEGTLSRGREQGQPASRIFLTDTGLEQFDAALQVILGAYERAFDGLGAADSARLLGLFEAFVDIYSDVAAAPEAPGGEGEG